MGRNALPHPCELHVVTGIVGKRDGGVCLLLSPPRGHPATGLETVHIQNCTTVVCLAKRQQRSL